MSKIDLSLSSPWMNAAGTLGFSPDPRAAALWQGLGAFITNPVSLGARSPAKGVRLLDFPGGFLLHSGYPNPGLRSVVRRHALRWAKASLPVIVHLLAQDAAQVQALARGVEGLEGVGGVELGLPEEIGRHAAGEFIQAACGELPLIARLPLARALELAETALHAGAAALSLAAPRGALPGAQGETVGGRLYGAALFPQALQIVRLLARRGLPVIAAGGVYRRADAEAMLACGALAVQFDSVLWRASKPPLPGG